MSSAIQVPCDAAVAEAVAARDRDGEFPHLVLAATILASSLAFIDGSVVNVGLPTIRDALHADPDALQWVINAYLLPLSALLLLGGATGDRIGRKLVLVVGITVFGAASALCAAAPDLTWLLAGRTVQGMSAAFVLPNSLGILGASFSGGARGRAIGFWAAAGAAVGAVGPVLGGWLIDSFGWRTIFMINLPVAAAAIVLALGFVRESPRESQSPSLDLLGSVLATAGLGALTWGLTVATGSAGWTLTSLVALAAGSVLIPAFLTVEARRGERAAMPVSLFRSSTFVGLTVLTLLLYGALGGLLVLIPYVLIGVAGYSGTAAGAALLPIPVVLALASPSMGAVVARVGWRLPLTIGPLLVAAGFFLLLLLQADNSYWAIVFPSLLLIAFGMSGAAAPLTTAVLASAGPRNSGSASGLNSAVSRLGGMIATAMLGGIFGARGIALIHGFHVAMLAGAMASLAASVTAFALIGNSSKTESV